MNLHPGVETLFKYMGGDELTVAELMQAGELQSPQQYRNVSLFKIRITGVAVSFRPTLNEWVYRRPEDYLTERFLRRCNGLPVIFQHPKKAVLNSDEFADRIVGTTFLPFLENDEVWAIVKIYDDETINLLKSEQMSTSPAVVLNKGSKKYQLEDGSTLLVEDRASLLDHIAICPNGVWDKGGDPTGVEANLTQELAMADDAGKKEEGAKVDAAAFDMMLSKIDACMTKMDAWEKKEEEKADAARKDAADKEEKEKADAAARKDADDKEKAEKEKADAARKDGAEGEAERLAADKKKADEAEAKDKEDKEKADAVKADARADAMSAKLDAALKTIEELTTMVRQPIADADRAGLAEVQSRADAIRIQLGERAEVPLVGESVANYRRRMLTKIQPLSSRWKDIDLSEFKSDASFANVEEQIYADATESARSPSNIAEGSIRAVRKTSETGHVITDYVGNGAHFVQAFSPRASMRFVKSFRIPASS